MKNKEKINQENNNNNNIDYISIIKEVFEYYCQYGERLNSKILKSHKFIKLFRESGLMDKKLDTTRLEIIYKSINKNNQMTFDQFLNSLLKIASYKYNLYDKKDIKKATQKIINDNIFPLYYSITNSNSLTDDMNSNNNANNDFSLTFTNKKFENILYSDLFKEILIQVVPVLFDIYRTFFTNETSISDDINYIRNTSLKNYFTLIKNLEIIPQLLSKSTCYQIYKYETNNSNSDVSIKNNQNFYFEICKKIDFMSMNTYERSNNNIFGKFFIFFKFIRVLIKMSQITFERIFESHNKNTINSNDEEDNNKMKPEEMFILFLQKLEQSEGFSNFTKINNVTHNYKTTTIIPANFTAKFEIMNCDKEEKEKEKEKQNQNNQIEKEEKIDIYQKLDAYEPKYINYINEVYGKDLLNLYKTIVSYGDQFNFQYMKSKAFFKFLVDSNLVKDKYHNFGLKVNDIDIFFIKMCLLMKNNEQYLNNNTNSHNNNNNKNNMMTVNVSYGEIDYPTFIISIEILARLLFNNISIKQAIDTLIVDYILNNKEINNNKINEIEEKIDNLKELQNNQDMIEILQIAHKAFYPLFIYYTNENEGLMSNKNFMKFTKDFEIFPYLIGKAKLNSFFNGISQYSMYGQKDSALIEHSLFVDLIALMALEMNYPSPEPSPVEKILIFIEKISQSQGPGKIALNTGNNRQSNCGNILELFKEKYPGYFAVEKSTEDDFSSIMQNDNDEDNEVENENNENNNYEENEEKNNEKGGDDDNIQKDNINSINSNQQNDNEENINENNINENEINTNNINENNINDNEINDNEINDNEINDNDNDMNNK